MRAENTREVNFFFPWGKLQTLKVSVYKRTNMILGMGIYTRALSVCLCYNQVSVPSCLLHMTEILGTQLGSHLQYKLGMCCNCILWFDCNVDDCRAN